MLSPLPMRRVENIRAYVRAVRGATVEQQRKLVSEAATAVGAPLTIYEESDGTVVDALIRATRGDELVILPRLHVLAPAKKEGGKRPLVMFTTRLQSLVRRAAYILDADSKISSNDEKWDDLVEWTGNLVAKGGRVLTRKKAQEMAAKSAARAEPGVVERWSAPHMEKHRDQLGSVWRDTARHKTAEAVWNSLPPEMREEFGSLRTFRNVLGPRRPGDPRAGGRPPKGGVRRPKLGDPPVRRVKKPGKVYFIQAGEGGPIKIGFATSVKGRLSAMQTGHAQRLSVLATIDGDMSDEKRMHARFLSLRMEGEWFRFDGRLKTYVERLIRNAAKAGN